MIASETVKVFKWRDIEEEICNKMRIPVYHFNEYHEVIGGGRKDLWDEFLEYFIPWDELCEGGIAYARFPISADEKPFEKSFKEDIVNQALEEHKEWVLPFLDAVLKVWKENEIEYVDFQL